MILIRLRFSFAKHLFTGFPRGFFPSCLLMLAVLSFLVPTSRVLAQEPPDPEFLFMEDRATEYNEQKKRDELKRKQEDVKKRQQSGQFPFDINAESISFDSVANKVIAERNVILSYGGIILEADKGEFDVETHDARIEGDVRLSDIAGDVTADAGHINLKSGEGELTNAKIFFEQGEYSVDAAQITKSETDDYTFVDAALTTCQCPEGDACAPWRISADEAEITQNGYGEVWDATLDVHDVPVFYLPYLFFPAKTDRQTGFLPATIGFGSENGFELETPFFWALNESTDMTISPVIETDTRYGGRTEFRKMFSRTHNLEMGAMYFNESVRDGELRGTNTDDIDDPHVGEDRSAGYIDHTLSAPLGENLFQLIIDGRYVSDNLIPREIENENIAEQTDRFVTSRAVARTSLFETYSLDLVGEYNQALVDDQDFVFQRLPEAIFGGFSALRPFGDNPYGLKTVFSTSATATQFSREKSFDGSRLDLYEKMKIPFFYKNYIEGTLEFDTRGTLYYMDETQVEFEEEEEDEETDEPGEEGSEEDVDLFEDLKDSSDRVVPGVGLKLSTTFERVFAVPQDSTLKQLAELGQLGRKEELVRIKHTLQPVLSYRYVPFVNQEENPQYDSIDQLARRNVVSYSLVQRLFTRYEPRNEYLYGIEEIAPEAEDLDSLKVEGPIDDEQSFGVRGGGSTEFKRRAQGSKLETAALSIGQSFDIDEERNDKFDEDAFSDVNVALSTFPNEYIRLRTSTNYDAEESQFSSYGFSTQLRDKRGDEIRAQLSFVDNNVRQLTTGAQLNLTERLKLGYYSEWDDLNAEFIENRIGMRVVSECNCWIFDLVYTDQINPDESSVSFNIVLIGLGEFGNSFLSMDEQEDSTT